MICSLSVSGICSPSQDMHGCRCLRHRVVKTSTLRDVFCETAGELHEWTMREGQQQITGGGGACVKLGFCADHISKYHPED